MQRNLRIVAVAATEELHQLNQQLAALGQVRGLEQGLLRSDIERDDLAGPIDQRFVIEPGYRFPIDCIALGVGKAPCLALEPGAFDRG